MEFFTVSMLNGLSYGLLLFMLSSGLTLIFSMMGVLNFAHASFYMVGAYLGFTLSKWVGFWPALVSFRSFHSMLQKPCTAPTGSPSDLRVSGGSAW